MFFHSLFSLELIALVSGVFLLLYVKNQEKIKSFWALFTAWLVVILAALSIILSIVFTIFVWSKGPAPRCFKNVEQLQKTPDRR